MASPVTAKPTPVSPGMARADTSLCFVRGEQQQHKHCPCRKLIPCSFWAGLIREAVTTGSSDHHIVTTPGASNTQIIILSWGVGGRPKYERTFQKASGPAEISSEAAPEPWLPTSHSRNNGRAQAASLHQSLCYFCEVLLAVWTWGEDIVTAKGLDLGSFEGCPPCWRMLWVLVGRWFIPRTPLCVTPRAVPPCQQGVCEEGGGHRWGSAWGREGWESWGPALVVDSSWASQRS